MTDERLTPRQRLLLFAVITVAVLLRAWHLDAPMFWVDEAESSINALTILQHGYPSNEYLGLPIYENTLVEPWPEHPEYEFKDISYSDKGFAVYHGWLPLYSIAAAFWAAGIKPDVRPSSWTPRLDEADHRYRTWVARVPAVVFSVVFLVLIFACGRVLAGMDVAWAALILAGFSQSIILLGKQARYYSATLAMNALALLFIVLAIRKGRWRDYVGAGIALGLLFHTHLLSAFVACLVFLATLFWQRHHERLLAKLAVMAVLFGVLTVPWMLWTGFLEHTNAIPKAWPLLTWSADVMGYLREKWEFALVYGVGVGSLLFVVLFPDRLPERISAPFRDRRAAFLLLGAWLVLGYLSFCRLIPAASFFWNRLSLAMHVAGLLLVALVFSCTLPWFTRRRTAAGASLLAVVFLTVSGRLPFQRTIRRVGQLDTLSVIGELPIAKQARFYASPNDHLTLTFYTGLPFQSLAPIRKTFLDTYPGDVVIVEKVATLIHDDDPIGLSGLRERAARAGVSVTEAELHALVRTLGNRVARERLDKRVASLVPPLAPLPQFVADAVAEQYELEVVHTARWWRNWHALPMFRGYHVSFPEDWWTVFFYRFVDPDSRRGEKLNCADRLKTAIGYLPRSSDWSVEFSKGTE